MDFFTRLVSFIVVLIFSMVLTFYGGYVLSVMWGWFIVSSFPQIPPISPLQGFGIMLTYSVFQVSRASWQALMVKFAGYDMSKFVFGFLINTFCVYTTCLITSVVIHAVFF